MLRYLRTSDNEKEVQRKRKELSNAFSEKETEELSASKKTRAEAELSRFWGLLTYPSLKPTLTLTSRLRQNVG